MSSENIGFFDRFVNPAAHFQWHQTDTRIAFVIGVAVTPFDKAARCANLVLRA